MHDGCSGTFTSGKQVVDKVRMMGFASGMIPDPIEMSCKHCGEQMQMTTYEFACPDCGAIHAVTPCHAFSADHVQCAGVGY